MHEALPCARAVSLGHVQGCMADLCARAMAHERARALCVGLGGPLTGLDRPGQSVVPYVD